MQKLLTCMRATFANSGMQTHALVDKFMGWAVALMAACQNCACVLVGFYGTAEL